MSDYSPVGLTCRAVSDYRMPPRASTQVSQHSQQRVPTYLADSKAKFLGIGEKSVVSILLCESLLCQGFEEWQIVGYFSYWV